MRNSDGAGSEATATIIDASLSPLQTAQGEESNADQHVARAVSEAQTGRAAVAAQRRGAGPRSARARPFTVGRLTVTRKKKHAQRNAGGTDERSTDVRRAATGGSAAGGCREGPSACDCAGAEKKKGPKGKITNTAHQEQTEGIDRNTQDVWRSSYVFLVSQCEALREKVPKTIVVGVRGLTREHRHASRTSKERDGKRSCFV